MLRELIDLRYGGNVTALARTLAGPDAKKDEIDRWRNYVNRWKRAGGDPNRHTPSDENLERLATALAEPVALLHLLYNQDRLLRELMLVQNQLDGLVHHLRSESS